MLYRIAGFIKEFGSWSGSATELLSVMNDSSVPPNKLMQQITRHYYDVFFPSGISYEQKKEAKMRRIILSYDPAKDKTLQDKTSDEDSDGSDGSQLHPHLALPSGSGTDAPKVTNTCV